MGMRRKSRRKVADGIEIKRYMKPSPRKRERKKVVLALLGSDINF